MISPLAVIDPKARIGSNVTIEPFTMVYGDVEIGDGTWIASNVTIYDGARIGKKLQDISRSSYFCHSSGFEIQRRKNNS